MATEGPPVLETGDAAQVQHSLRDLRMVQIAALWKFEVTTMIDPGMVGGTVDGKGSRDEGSLKENRGLPAQHLQLGI